MRKEVTCATCGGKVTLEQDMVQFKTGFIAHADLRYCVDHIRQEIIDHIDGDG